jgi:S1-C subfamily serine protease
MIKRCLLITGVFLLVSFFGFSQKNGSKIYFDKSGKTCSEEVSHYYRQESDTSGFFRSFYTSNGRVYFEGRIKSTSAEDESKNVYTGTCTWYYKNGNTKQLRGFNDKGQEIGISRYYYESGKIWKELEFELGKVKNNTFAEYNEDGSKNRIFEEEFLNNSNEWDLYMSDKSTATIAGGMLELISTSKEGTSRYINHPVEAGEYTIEASINISTMKDNDRVGIIYGFKDWQNYHFFAISKKNIYIGSFYEGVRSTDVEDMYCSAINPMQNNTVKILCTSEKSYFSINGEIQYKDDNNKLFGNNFGFVLSGNSKLKVDKFTIKEVNVSGSNSGSGSKEVAPTDRDIKATGSGLIFTTSGLILTNHHVVDNSKKLIVEVNSNSSKVSYNAEVIIEDKENDLAIIKIKDENFKELPQINYSFKENGALDVGGSVFTMGYPHALSGMGKEAKFTDGKISSKTGYNGSINSFQTSIPVQPGNSGGPIFNENGQLIGVINAKFKDGDNVSYGIKLNYVKNLIELLTEKADIPNNTSISTLSLEEKIKVLTNYVVLIKIK